MYVNFHHPVKWIIYVSNKRSSWGEIGLQMQLSFYFIKFVQFKHEKALTLTQWQYQVMARYQFCIPVCHGVQFGWFLLHHNNNYSLTLYSGYHFKFEYQNIFCYFLEILHLKTMQVFEVWNTHLGDRKFIPNTGPCQWEADLICF